MAKQKKSNKKNGTTTGRPAKLNKKLQEEITKYLRAGNYVETVCAFVGLHKDTFYRWMRRGAVERQRVEDNPRATIRQEEEKYVAFSDAVKQAQANAEMRDVALIAKASEEYWQAAAWRLERKHPERWGRKDRVTAELDHKGQVDVNMSDEQVDSRIEELEKKLGIDDDGQD